MRSEELVQCFGAHPERARAARAVEAAARSQPARWLREKRLGKPTQKQLAYERRRQKERTRLQKRAARLPGEGLTQEQAAAAIGVRSRTLRTWKTAPAFVGELERAPQHRENEPAPARASSTERPLRRRPEKRKRDRAPASSPRQQPTAEPDAEQVLSNG